MTQALRTKEAAKVLNVSAGTLEVWRCKGRGPKYSKLGKVVVYDPADLQSFLDGCKVLTRDTMPRRAK
ncbi:helix-turn-helix transcriptional regulator [Desulfovibrio inopinatus]|uniref:helix-turn-helix transcriptional regulator n=1 Tax=Desulfovibrio inopinatus TaxID=102109 RepID=UPI000401001E|nr:helix-turn-helix domain-containing protein [Desulfovibrio inopinatus]